MLKRIAFLSALLWAVPSIAWAQAVCVNVAGAEFGTKIDRGELPGTLGKEYAYPGNRALAPFLDGVKDAAGNVIAKIPCYRVPVRWERLARQGFFKPLTTPDVTELDAVVANITGNGGQVIIDVHNYGRFMTNYIGFPDGVVSVEAFVDFWQRLAVRYKDNPNVIFGLMNEPMKHTAVQWREIGRAAIMGIRAVGANNLILMPGTNWTGVWSWGQNNAPALTGFIKPEMGPVCFEGHSYFDKDRSGRSEIESVAKIAADYKFFLGWLRAEKACGFIGEYGFTKSDLSMQGLAAFLQLMEANKDVIKGHAFWSAGDRWGSYLYSIHPSTTGETKPQAILLANAAKNGERLPTGAAPGPGTEPPPAPDPQPDPVPDDPPPTTEPPAPDPVPGPDPKERPKFVFKGESGPYTVTVTVEFSEDGTPKVTRVSK